MVKKSDKLVIRLFQEGEMMTKIKSVIFDMDGVLINSEQFYQDSLMEFFRLENIDVPKQRLQMIIGANAKMNVWPKVLEGIDLHDSYENVLERMHQHRHGHRISNYQPLLIPHVQEILESLSKKGMMLALASSSSFASIEKMLSDTQLHSYFKLVTSGEMFKESKPNPEIYLFTANKLNCQVEECLVIEDSKYGIQAGISAGMTVIARHDPVIMMDQSQADYRVDSLLEIENIIEEIQQR